MRRRAAARSSPSGTSQRPTSRMSSAILPAVARRRGRRARPPTIGCSKHAGSRSSSPRCQSTTGAYSSWPVERIVQSSRMSRYFTTKRLAVDHRPVRSPRPTSSRCASSARAPSRPRAARRATPTTFTARRRPARGCAARAARPRGSRRRSSPPCARSSSTPIACAMPGCCAIQRSSASSTGTPGANASTVVTRARRSFERSSRSAERAQRVPAVVARQVVEDAVAQPVEPEPVADRAPHREDLDHRAPGRERDVDDVERAGERLEAREARRERVGNALRDRARRGTTRSQSRSPPRSSSGIDAMHVATPAPSSATVAAIGSGRGR